VTRDLKISLISPTERSGGALYSKKLAKVLDADVVPAEHSLLRILKSISKHEPDVVDIQFEYTTFGSHLRTVVLLPVLALLLRAYSRVVITVHGIVTNESVADRRFPRTLVSAYTVSVRVATLFACAIVVHSTAMERALAHLGVKRMYVIPHGSDAPSPNVYPTLDEVILFFGFLKPSKGIDRLIEAYSKVEGVYPNSKLLIAGSVQSLDGELYLENLRELVQTLGLEDKVSFRIGFFTEQEKRSLGSEARILVLPYVDRFVEVSGVAHDFAGSGLILICSRTPRFEEFTDGVDCMKIDTTASEIAKGICELLDGPQRGNHLRTGLVEFAKSTSWPKIAEARLRLYKHLLSAGS